MLADRAIFLCPLAFGPEKPVLDTGVARLESLGEVVELLRGIGRFQDRRQQVFCCIRVGT